MKNQHTPGPWKVTANDGWHSSPIVIVNCEESIAQASPIGSVEEQSANAKLIAAAPELLEALQAIMELPAHEPARIVLLIPQIKAAIEKATA